MKFFRWLPNYFFKESSFFSCEKTTMKISRPVNEFFSEVVMNLKLFDTGAFWLVSEKFRLVQFPWVQWTCKKCQWEIISVTLPIKTFAYCKKTGRKIKIPYCQCLWKLTAFVNANCTWTFMNTNVTYSFHAVLQSFQKPFPNQINKA